MAPYKVELPPPQTLTMENQDQNAAAVTARELVCLHLISSLDPRGGGPQEGLLQLTAAAVRAGQHVEVASMDDPESAWAAHYDCPAHLLGPAALGRYGYGPALLQWLVANAPRFNAVVVHGLWQFHGLAAWRLWRRTGTPYLVYTHGMLDPWFKRTYPLKHVKKSLYWTIAEYRVLRDARCVLFTCEEERVLARQSFQRYSANECVVGFGIAQPPGNPTHQRAAFFERFPQLHDRRLLLFLGRIHPKKGCDLLIEALAAALPENPSMHLVMAGPDQSGVAHTLRERAARLGIAQRITWTGMLSGDLKWGAFHAAEAFVLPSHQENFGVAVVEALACGLPVLISDKVNIWREIAAHGAGIVAGDSLAGTRQLFAAWAKLDAGARQRMAQHAREVFGQQFQVDGAARQLNAAITGARPASA
jgi:glycosyltransferase involved in cell wall biosynthesis